ncbi:MAG TPA: hypothetical protein VE553_10845 [Candidatus Binatia bacterium]|jgi:hypothetical protein|nr:hypothetical protein [Candidatus Binatia bacterium]
MNDKLEERFAVLAAILVLFTALLNPIGSAMLALFLLLVYLVYRNYLSKKGQ